jgi:chromosome segregation ATPase
MGRVGREAYGQRATIGSNTPAERVEMVREVEPEPDPTELEAALSRWEGEPDVPAIQDLRDLAGAIEELKARAGELEGDLTDAIVEGDPEAEADVLEEQSKVERQIRGRLAAIPRIEARIPAELVEYYKGQIEVLEEKRAEAQSAVEPLKQQYLDAKTAAEQLQQAWREALNKARFTGEEIGDLRRKIENLKN